MDDKNINMTVNWNEILVVFHGMKSYINRTISVSDSLQHLIESSLAEFSEDRLKFSNQIFNARRNLLILSRRIELFIKKKCGGITISDEWKTNRDELATALELVLSEFDEIRKKIMNSIKDQNLGEESFSVE